MKRYIVLGSALVFVLIASVLFLFNKPAEIEKRSADAWIALGRAEWQQRNFDEAEKAALKAREIDPRHPAISDLLLHVYFDLDEPGKFQAELDRAGNPAKPVQDLAIRFF